MDTSVESFYDQLSSEYTALISKCVPRYDEMFYNLFCYLPQNFNPKRILDLGCGTGNLTAAILHHFPNSEIHVLDISADILKECKERFKHQTNIIYHQQDFSQLNFEDNYFDLVISSIAIHHIQDPEKAKLYQKILQILSPGGIFEFVDQTKGSTEEIYQTHINRWKEEAFKLGSTQENWDMWMQHQNQHDYHTPVLWHLEQLREKGFINIDVIWKNMMWAVIYARKSKK
ncbi:class I SAM-dependent methyltransferase [Pelobium sp.]|nr:class I SAM-dependent methyltransferase [Pelobium sp.]MDA9554768.1 class I SAM-dependent methyltransferase [Pelobium sp.]